MLAEDPQVLFIFYSLEYFCNFIKFIACDMKKQVRTAATLLSSPPAAFCHLLLPPIAAHRLLRPSHRAAAVALQFHRTAHGDAVQDSVVRGGRTGRPRPGAR